MFDDLVRLAGERRSKLGIGSFAENKNLTRIAAAGKEQAETFGEGQGGDKDRHGQPDAKRRHERRTLALRQVAEVVSDGDAHEFILQSEETQRCFSVTQ